MLSKSEPTFIEDDHAVYGNPGDLTPWDVRYDPADRAHLDTEPDDSVRIRVWTDPALAGGLLVVRLDDDTVATYAMSIVATTERFTFWEVVADVADGVRYTFAFKAPTGHGVYIVPDGVSNAVERLDRWTLDKPDFFRIPGWSAGAVIYQIFPDRFARRDTTDDRDLVPWASEPTPLGFHGGNLLGIVDRLDHLEAVGADIVYLNPVFEAPSNHRYDTIDYLKVDPLLGGNEAFDELIMAAHARGFKVILDTSFNHVHTKFFAFRDVIEKGPESQYWDWFIVHEWPIKVRYRDQAVVDDPSLRLWLDMWKAELGIPFETTEDGWQWALPTYDSWYGVPSLPRVNLANPQARAYMLEVTASWLRDHELDGWRMDVVRYVDPDFWDDFRTAARTARSDAYLLCEIMGDASTWLQGDRFDATMNYTFRDLCVRFLATEEIDGIGMMEGMARSWAQYGWGVTLASQNLIGSHDTPRFLTEAGGEAWRLDLATVVQLTFPGAPGILYGDEMELEGGNDPGMRGPFPWDDEPESHKVFRTLRDLGKLRRAEPALVTGEWRPVTATSDVIAFERVSGDGRRIVTIINRAARSQSIDVGPVSAVLWGAGSIEGSVVVVEPRSAVVLAR